MTALLAQAAGLALAGWLKVIVIIAALVAVVAIAVRAMGVAIPPWLVQMFWVVVIAAAAFVAIGLLTGLV